MNILEKAEKALEHLKNVEGTSKSHELQSAAGTLGRCLGTLGSRPNYSSHYANLLHSAIPTLLALASNKSAEVRLVGDEALNRVVVGGFAFHAHKTNILLQNQIDVTKNARWIRAALSRACLGDSWLRPGPGKIRAQAQTLIPKLSQIVRQTDEIQLIVEALDANLPRILKALVEYTTDEEIFDLLKSLLHHIESLEPAVRRGTANCVAGLCTHRDGLVHYVLDMVFENLWPQTSNNSTTQGWFGVVKALLQLNTAPSVEIELFNVQDYLELYYLCINYIQQSTTEHNVQNAVMECLSLLLSQSTGEYKKALLEKHPRVVNLDFRVKKKKPFRNVASVPTIPAPVSIDSTTDLSEMSFRGALQLTPLSMTHTPATSIDDLTIQTPDSPVSEIDIQMNEEQLNRDLSEKLQEIEACMSTESDVTDHHSMQESGYKVNIGSASDDEIPLRYCARLLASKFLLTGNKGGFISDRSVRVSVKSSALTCLSEILHHYPQAITLYIDKDTDAKAHNVSGSSDGTDSNQDQINDFILERNVCYQDSLSNSLTQDLLNKSFESQLAYSQQISNNISKKDSRSLEKSIDSIGQKSSSKDVQSTILDSKIYTKNDLIASGMSVDSTNMTNSNFTNFTNTSQTTEYPMSSSGDILTSSIDLDMKFDHFGDSFTKEVVVEKRVLRRSEEVCSKDTLDGVRCTEDRIDVSKEFEPQHMSDLFNLYHNHTDPQIRGILRLCIGNYVYSALDLSHGDFGRWKNFSLLPKEVCDDICTEKLVDIVLKGLTDEIHSCVNHTLNSLTKIVQALSTSSHYNLIPNILNSLVAVEKNNYWLCKVNLCKLYEKLPFKRISMLYTGYNSRCKMIMDTLYRLLADPDQKVRNAAAKAIALIIPYTNIGKQSPTETLISIAHENSEHFKFDYKGRSTDIVRDMYFYNDLPEQFKAVKRMKRSESLKCVVGDVMAKIMCSSCKFYTQGLLECLQAITREWPPWTHIEAYSGQSILEYCIENLDSCNGTVTSRTIMMELCSVLYPVEIHNQMRHKTKNHDIFERDADSALRWQHLSRKMAELSEKYQIIILRTLNVLVHLIEEVSPSVQMNKVLPGSPVRRTSTDTTQRKSTDTTDDKSLRRKQQMVVGNLRANFVGNFYTEPFYLKLYDSLRATYSNHKINLDPKTSMFHQFVTTVLKSLTILLELSTEKEFGYITEELLYYIKSIMPLCADRSVECVTQLLKCLFSKNILNQYSDFMTVCPLIEDQDEKISFYKDVLMLNKLNELSTQETDSRRSSACSNFSTKLSLDTKNPVIVEERSYLNNLENFKKNRLDRKWNTNKKEFERYIRLFEPVVIQALKSYTMQNDIPLQCNVLSLLNQLLMLKVNYCMLDRDQVFIGFLMKQLDYVEQNEIPNCSELVSSILLFLVQLSSFKHHSKQIIELPKLIQLCDGLLASGGVLWCVGSLRRVAPRPFALPRPPPDVCAAREVLFAILLKTMHTWESIDLVSCILALSQEQAESYYRWSQLTSDNLLSLLSKRSIDIDSRDAIASIERLIDSIYRDVLLEQNRVELVLKMLFQCPPEQSTTPFKEKLRYLSIIMILLRKILVLVPESEILLSINYLKATLISPQSIFFNVKPDVDPLNVQNVNENCANLSPDVILVRFLFKTLTYVILEIDSCHEIECANLDLKDEGGKGDNHRLLYCVCVNIICQVKNMLHLTSGCLFPLTAKTAQNILHNEQSGLNTGLYSPDENIPLELLNLISLRSAHRIPLLTVHWSHLLIRLKFLEQKYWQNLLGFVRNLPLISGGGDKGQLQYSVLQIGCVMAYCEYFVENGLSEAVHLTWLLVNRIHILTSYFNDECVRALVSRVHDNASASGLLLQAVAARCQTCLKDGFALNTCRILSGCHESQSGALIFLICRIIGKMEPAIALRFAKLAMDRCGILKEMSADDILTQLCKEDVQVALELLHRDKVHVRYPSLVMEVNALATTVFDLSPLDLSQERTVNPQYVASTSIDGGWLTNLIKNRCFKTPCASTPKVEKQNELAQLLSNLSKEDLTAVMSCQEFDRRLLRPCFKLSCDMYLRDFYEVISIYESRETEKDLIKERKEIMRYKEDLANSMDSNKINVANTLQVFKKSDAKESKSQFFIPITEDLNKFGNLQLTDEEYEIVSPNVPDLYVVAVSTLDKSLSDLIKLFPKQNRPLSQSENFNLNLEHSMDKYTKRCHQIFQDNIFYQDFLSIQTCLEGFLDSLQRFMTFFTEIDIDIQDKCMETIVPSGLSKNISSFVIISLQYLSFLIKNKKIVESPIHTDVSFKVNSVVTEKIVIDHIIGVTLENISQALQFKEIWTELNCDKNINRVHSAVSCLYGIVKYFVKETKPITVQTYMTPTDEGPKSDINLTCDKLLTLIEYWEDNFYKDGRNLNNEVLGQSYKKCIESLIVSLARLEILSNVALIPPIAWRSMEVSPNKDEALKVDLPLQSLQDMDVLEAFLFRINLIGWSSKKQFEEIWVALLAALQGNGTHWAVRGITQLLLSTIPKVWTHRGLKMMHLPRKYLEVGNGIHRLRSILIGTSAYNDQFSNINLDRIPLMNDSDDDGYYFGQFNVDYLKLASEITEDAPFRVKMHLKRMRSNEDIDVNSCLQLLMDVATQMLDPKADTGLAARGAVLSLSWCAADVFRSFGSWCWLGGLPPAQLPPPLLPARVLPALALALATLRGVQGIEELSTVHAKLLKSLTSNFAPLRQAAIQGCLLQLYGTPEPIVMQQCPSNPYQELIQQLNVTVKKYLGSSHRISLHEQSLYWTVLFALVELGHPDLVTLAVDFVISSPRHYCTELVVKGITSMIRNQVLPKDLKNSMIEKLMDNMKSYSEHHAVQIMMVHLFSADNKLLSPKLSADASNMDPDVLMNSMERITLLYKLLRDSKSKETKEITAKTLKYFLKETLPPASTLSRAVIEFLESCKLTETVICDVLGERQGWVACSVLSASVVFEVFETGVAQDQLPMLSGWIFEALSHLVSGKISTELLPYCVLLLLVSASSNHFLRKLSPLCYQILRLGFENCQNSPDLGIFNGVLKYKCTKMSFADRKLLCLAGKHSGFSQSQLLKLKELCRSNKSLEDLFNCLV